MSRCSRALDMAVAGGENEFTRWGFRDAIMRKAMDIVQPDVCAAGGITECKKIAALASVHGVECVPHAWGSAVGLAATIHFLASIPEPAAEPVPDAADARIRAGGKPVPRSSGASSRSSRSTAWSRCPAAPGLGIEVDRAVIDRYRVA